MGSHQQINAGDVGAQVADDRGLPPYEVPTTTASGIGNPPVMTAGLRLLAAGVVGLTLLLMLVGFVFDVDVLRGGGVATFLLLELGVAPCLLGRPAPALWFAFRALVGGLTAMVLLGFAMSVLHVWQPTGMLILVLVLTVGMLGVAVRRDLGEFRASGRRVWRRPQMTPALAVNGAVALGVLVAVVTALTHRTNPDPGGLMSILGPGWYVGLLLIVAATVAAWRFDVSPAFAVLALSGVVVLSQVLTYGAPAVMSAARHVGIIDFIRVHHGVQIELDIYQAWSGMFAGIAWLCDAGRITDALVIATWWPVILSPVITLAVAVMASRWVSGSFRIWFAGAVFTLTSTLNVIYFSPQSLGLLLAVAIFAVAATPQKSGMPRSGEMADSPDDAGKKPSVVSAGFRGRLVQAMQPLGAGRVGFIFFVSCGMAVSHQISPYLTVAALAILSIFRLVRPWWISLVILFPAVVWAFLNRGVLGGFVSLGAIGRLWDNVQPPTHVFAQYEQPLVTRLAFYLPALVLFLVGLVALIHAVRVRARHTWAILLAAASPASLFAATDYGQEGIFRVVLFAGPWLAVLAAGVVWTRRSGWTIAALTTTVLVLLGVNAFGQTALDWNRMIRQDTAAATLLFESTAQDGAVVILTGTGNATPLARTARYLDVAYLSREGFGGYPAPGAPYDPAADVEQLTRNVVNGYAAPQYYALVSDSIGAYGERYGFQPYSQYAQLAAAMAESPLWKPIFQGPTSTLYELSDPAALRTP